MSNNFFNLIIRWHAVPIWHFPVKRLESHWNYLTVKTAGKSMANRFSRTMVGTTRLNNVILHWKNPEATYSLIFNSGVLLFSKARIWFFFILTIKEKDHPSTLLHSSSHQKQNIIKFFSYGAPKTTCSWGIPFYLVQHDIPGRHLFVSPVYSITELCHWKTSEYNRSFWFFLTDNILKYSVFHRRWSCSHIEQSELLFFPICLSYINDAIWDL